MKKAYQLGVAPEYIGYIYCTYNGKRYALIIMKRYGSGTLTDLYNNGEYARNKDIINDKLRVILNILYENGIDQKDLHSQNFLYHNNSSSKSDGGAIDNDYTFKIIDFGLAGPLQNRSRDYKISIIGTNPPFKFPLPPFPGMKFIDLESNMMVKYNRNAKKWVEVSPEPQ